MASLSGTKIKDSFNILLKMATSTLSGTKQSVQDGDGNNSALKLSTSDVEVAGALSIVPQPATTSTELTALLIATSGTVVTRELDTSAFGSASITANSPLAATGNTIGVDDPVNLSQITSTTALPADKYLIWDESTSSYKYILFSDLVTFVQNSAGTTNFLPVLSLVANAGTSIPTASTVVSWQSIAAGAGKSSTAGFSVTDQIQLQDAAELRSSILINLSGTYKFEVCMQIESSSGTPNINAKLLENGASTNIQEMNQTMNAQPEGVVTFTATVQATAGEDYSVFMSSSSTATYSTNSYCIVTQIA
jgi:hypothetical protein|tara:strand:- start:1899 stop:2819 length:921 start_codon:yes stop_codon:yes gene_type:complete